MIEPESFIGFGLVLVGTSLALSAILGAVFFLLRPRLRRLGPYAERAGAGLAVVLPPLLGLGISGALAVRSLLGLHLGLEDHCPAHAHHLHLCLIHGASWAQQGWAVAALAGASTAVVLGMGRRIWRGLGARLALRRLARVARRLPGHAVPVGVTPADTVFCFTAGLVKPRIFISSAAWNRLDVEERRAVIAHELAHVAHGDVRRRGFLGLLSLFGLPFLTARLLDAWERATERACDCSSARVVGSSAPVASALVKLSRAPKRQALAFAASFPSGDVVERVESVLGDGPDGRREARSIALCALFIFVALLLASGAFVEPLHHAAETLLGMS